jgi:hypothetical protein
MRARPVYVECLEMRKSIVGENYLDTLNSMNNLAALLWVASTLVF